MMHSLIDPSRAASRVGQLRRSPCQGRPSSRCRPQATASADLCLQDCNSIPVRWGKDRPTVGYRHPHHAEDSPPTCGDDFRRSLLGRLSGPSRRLRA